MEVYLEGFLRISSAIERCPLYDMSTIERFDWLFLHVLAISHSTNL